VVSADRCAASKHCLSHHLRPRCFMKYAATSQNQHQVFGAVAMSLSLGLVQGALQVKYLQGPQALYLSAGSGRQQAVTFINLRGGPWRYYPMMFGLARCAIAFAAAERTVFALHKHTHSSVDADQQRQHRRQGPDVVSLAGWQHHVRHSAAGARCSHARQRQPPSRLPRCRSNALIRRSHCARPIRQGRRQQRHQQRGSSRVRPIPSVRRRDQWCGWPHIASL